MPGRDSRTVGGTTGKTSYDAIVFDLDGTLYRGDAAIPGAPEAVTALREFGRCLFLSNNGECTSPTLARRLIKLGFDVHESEVTSSADLVVNRLEAEKPGARVLGLVSAELTRTLEAHGFEVADDSRVDFVAVGVDRELTRRRLVLGLEAMLGGAALVATNEDPTYPGGKGIRPAAGAYVGFFRGMGFEPAWRCGKPDVVAVESALRGWGLPRDGRYLFVGDNLHSDIAAAERMGAESALVLSGVAREADLEKHAVRPTVVVDDVARLAQLLERNGGDVRGGRGRTSTRAKSARGEV